MLHNPSLHNPSRNNPSRNHPRSCRNVPATALVVVLGLYLPLPAFAQLLPAPTSPKAPAPASLLSDPTASPALQFLYRLEADFASATAAGGGPAFASYFADDAVTLAEGKPPILGRPAIAAQATWTPAQYQLSWTPDGGLMGPSGDMGYTWGHYTGRSREAGGAPIQTSGRYLTLWKKQRDGVWKVEMDASNDGPALDCCKLP